MKSSTPRLWGIVLAGSDGPTDVGQATANRRWTLRRRQRPPQFSRVGGPHTLFRQTMDRAARLIPAERLVAMLTRDHSAHYEDELRPLPAIQRIVQPAYRGSAAETFLAALKIAAGDPDALVVVMPSDHLVDRDARFMSHVARASRAVTLRPELSIVIGAWPLMPDPCRTWIEPGAPMAGLERFAVRAVTRFVQWPEADELDVLYRGNALLSTLVVVATARTLIELGRRYLPEVLETLEPLEGAFGEAEESLLCEAVYEGMPYVSVSQALLRSGERVGVLPIPDVMWSDWARPAPYALAS